MKTFSTTSYLPAKRTLRSYDSTGRPVETDLEAGAMMVAYYLKYHCQYNCDPHYADGVIKCGKRIRVLCRGKVEGERTLIDIKADGNTADPEKVDIDPETGLQRCK